MTAMVDVMAAPPVVALATSVQKEWSDPERSSGISESQPHRIPTDIGRARRTPREIAIRRPAQTVGPWH